MSRLCGLAATAGIRARNHRGRLFSRQDFAAASMSMLRGAAADSARTPSRDVLGRAREARARDRYFTASIVLVIAIDWLICMSPMLPLSFTGPSSFPCVRRPRSRPVFGENTKNPSDSPVRIASLRIP